MSRKSVSGMMLTLLLIGMLTLAFNIKLIRVWAQGPNTTIRVLPSLIEYRCNATGREFTIAVVVENVTFLWGVDIWFSWDPTILEYVEHTAMIPVDDYPGGVLYEPLLPIADAVDAAAGTYHVTKTSMLPAQSFNGSGTIFVMTLRVKCHPKDVNTTIPLDLVSTDIAAKAPAVYLYPSHEVLDGLVTLYAYELWICDLNGDCTVNIDDAVMACSAYGSKEGDPNWNPLADLAPPWGVINIYDIATITFHFGETYP